MSQFILIDPSIKDTGGHYYEYALRVLMAAKASGHAPVLAAHREAEDMDGAGFAVMRQFHHDFFENADWMNADELRARKEKEKAKASAERKARREAATFARRELSRAGLDRARAAELMSTTDPSFALLTSPWAEYRSSGRRLMINMITRRIASRFSRVQRRLGRYTRPGGRLSRYWRRFSRLATIGMRVSLALALAPIGSLRERLFPSNRQRLFEQDLLATLRKGNAQAGDVVFVPTLGELELAGIVALCQRNPLARSLRWRLLFRRNIFSSSTAQRSQEANRPALRRMRSLLSYARNALRGVDVEFFTDTKPLSAQYASLGIFPFRTAPIPVDARYASTRKRRAANDPIVFTYLGDARTEKGFPSLPGAIDQLAHEFVLPHRIRMVAQSNFNTKEGEPDCVRAHLALMTWPQENVRRVYGPLDTDAYVELMREADVILIPYSGENYSARSSGVFAEALRAGVPTIVTGGSWMAGILEPYRQAHLETAFARIGSSRREFLRAERIEGDRMLGDMVEIPVGRSGMIAAEIDCAINPESFLKLDYELISTSGASLGHVSEHVALISGKLRALTCIPEGVRWIRINASVPGSLASIVPERIVLSLVTRQQNVAIGMGGVICDGTAASLALAMRNIALNFESYAADARRLAVEVGAGFTPERLVEMLAGAVGAGGGDAGRKPAPRPVPIQRQTQDTPALPQAALNPLSAGGHA